MPVRDPGEMFANQVHSDAYRGMAQQAWGQQGMPLFPKLELPPEPPKPSITTHVLCNCGCAVRHDGRDAVVCQRCGRHWEQVSGGEWKPAQGGETGGGEE